MIKELGGDFDGVIGGIFVIFDWLEICVESEVGIFFLDKMIVLVEGVERNKILNEIVFFILLIMLIIIFLVVIVMLYLIVFYLYLILFIVMFIVLIVCLILMIIGGLLLVIGIVGMDCVI